jgi:hypothetical protein
MRFKRSRLMKSEIDADTKNIIGEPSVRGDHISW